MTVRSEAELNQLFADGQFRTNSAQKIRDLIDSKFANGGIMYCEDVLSDVMTNYTPCDFFTHSTDTKALNENLAQGEYAIGPGGDGAYIFFLNAVIVPPLAGELEFIFARNGVTVLPFKCPRAIGPGEDSLFTLMGGWALDVGDTLGVGWKADGNANGIEIKSAQFLLARI